MLKLPHRLEIQSPLNISVSLPETLFFFVTSVYNGEAIWSHNEELDAGIRQSRINCWEALNKISNLRGASAYRICEMGKLGPTV